MSVSPFSFVSQALPRPANPARLALGLEQWHEQARSANDADLRRFATDFAADPSGASLLAAIFGNSPFLGHCLLKETPLLRSLIAQGAEAVFAELLTGLGGVANETDTSRAMQALRQARRRAALLVALADIAGHWPLERATAALSHFADAALGAVTRHLLARAAAAGDLALPDADDPARGSGLVIIGMGKLGARELNYSSDIDLIVLYDRAVAPYRGTRTVQDMFVRLTRDLVRMLEERTGDGYVFRTDLRLRPDPGSTPLALSVAAAETYYEGVGQNWERAAMIKSRALAGDPVAGAQFLARLRPFVWRRHLDFAAIQDIHSIKRQIHAVKGHHDIAVAGHNIKLGRGGIREIEFFAQTQQLIWGGRQPELRQPGTCAAIRALVTAGRVAPTVADDMIAAYRYLRHVEHRLQMVEDRQTQTLPPEGPDLDAIACFVGAPSTEAFIDETLKHLARVEEHYAGLFEEAPSLGGSGSLVFTGTDNDPDTVATLVRLGFTDGGAVSAAVRGWHAGRYRAMRSARARELLTELMPALLDALSRTTHPDAAFQRFDEFLSRLPAGVQLFALLQANPGLLDLIAEVMGGAPRLAEHLSRNPALLEAVLNHGFFDPLPSASALNEELQRTLAEAQDYQDVLDLTRRWARDRQFQAGLRVLRHISDADAAGRALSDVADVAIAALQPHVEAEFARLHGRLPGRGMAVLALGKLGGREMSIGSDLDLIFIYDAPDVPGGWDHAQSDGPKPLAPIHYYARLAQRFINALTAPTGEGKLFDIDMRLRPSGANGPIASSLDGFLRYQEENAWVWEHMALLRARPVAGDAALAADIERALRLVLTRPRDPKKLVKDVAEMRERVARQHPTDRFWDLKHVRGGLMDVEYLAQYPLLRHAAAHPGILRASTEDSFAALAAAGLMEPAVAKELIGAVRLWRRLQGFLRLTVGEDFDEAALPPGLRRSLAQASRVADFDRLKEVMAATMATVAGHYQRVIATPALL